jgi:hypothetical protein
LDTVAKELFARWRYDRCSIMNPNKPVRADNHPVDKPRRQVPHEKIAQRAEKIWRERNCPAGSDEAIWFEAENQLQGEAESQPVSGTPSRPYTDEPAQPVRNQTRSRDPADMAAQTRSATERKTGPARPPKGNKSLRSQ